MAKKIGSTSFEKKTIAELKSLLGGREDIPVKVSKKWLTAAQELLGGGIETDEGDEEDDAPTAATAEPEKGGGVKIQEN